MTNNDFDEDGDPLQVVKVGTTPYGNTTVVDNAILFEPNADFNGRVVFPYYATDGDSAPQIGHVLVIVQPVNDAPQRSGGPGNQFDNDSAAVSLGLGAFYTDADIVCCGDALHFAANGLPLGLSINETTGLVSGTLDHSASQSSPFVVNVFVSDNDGLVAPALSFSWVVSNIAPQAQDDNMTIGQGQMTQVHPLQNDVDPDQCVCFCSELSAGLTRV